MVELSADCRYDPLRRSTWQLNPWWLARLGLERCEAGGGGDWDDLDHCGGINSFASGGCICESLFLFETLGSLISLLRLNLSTTGY